MYFLPLQQDFYSKSRHASPQNSSQIYAYVWKSTGRVVKKDNTKREGKNVHEDADPISSYYVKLLTER